MESGDGVVTVEEVACGGGALGIEAQGFFAIAQLPVEVVRRLGLAGSGFAGDQQRAPEQQHRAKSVDEA